MPAYLKPVDKGQRIAISKAIVLVGRHPECDVVLKGSRKISRKHCCFAQVNADFFLRDLGSLNGVRLNGEAVHKEAVITDGDRVTIGEFEYVFRVTAASGDKSSKPNGKHEKPRPRSSKRHGPASFDFPVPASESGDFSLDDLPDEASAYPLLDVDDDEG